MKGMCTKNERMKGSVCEKLKNERECVGKMKEWKGVCAKNERMKGSVYEK